MLKRGRSKPIQGLVRALLVGIDAYRSPVPPLSGCGNDIAEAAVFLHTLLGDRLRLLVLRDEAATRQAVVSAFRDHLGQAGQDDAVLFWFCGHGSESPVAEEFWHLEPTGMQQTLVCADSRHDGVPDLTDKELSVLIDEVAADGAHVAAILDCCHSGGGTRDIDARIRGIPAAGVHSAMSQNQPTGSRILTRAAVNSHVALSACRSFEKATEREDVDGRVRGVFSAALFRALQTLGPDATYRALHTAARCSVEDRADTQTPVIYPALPMGIADEPFLGGAATRPPAFTLRRINGRWQVNAGWCHGIPPSGDGDVIMAVAPGDPRAAGRRLIVAETRAGSCDVRPLGWTPDEDAPYPVVISERPNPLVGVVVGGASTDNAAACARVRRALTDLAPSGTVKLVRPDEPGPGLRLRIAAPGQGTDPVLAILRGDGSPAAEPVRGHDDRSARTVAARVDHIARWTLLKDLQNPVSPLDGLVRVEIVAARPGDVIAPRTGRAIPPDEAGVIQLSYTRTDAGWRAPEIFIRIRNDSGRRLWCVLLNLTDSYRCHTTLFPGAFIETGHVGVAFEGKALPVRLPRTRPVVPGATVRDWCNLIVSGEEINTLAFEMPSLGEVGDQDVEPTSLRGLLRDICPDPVHRPHSHWTTSLTPIVTSIPENGSPPAT